MRPNAQLAVLASLSLCACSSPEPVRASTSASSAARSASSVPSPLASAAPPASSALSPAPSASPPAVSDKPRVYIKNRFVFVRPRPDVNADWLGFLWFGASVELRSTAPQGGPGCATFYAIEPMGFVCVDDKQATLAADDPVYQAVAHYAPRLEQAAPHRYAESIGASLVSQVPGSEPSWPALPAFGEGEDRAGAFRRLP